MDEERRVVIEVAYRYITRAEGVRSGQAIVEGTRIGVHDVVGLVLNGASVDDVVRSFPSLSRAQVYECLAYYEDNKGEIDLAVAEQMAEGAAMSMVTSPCATDQRKTTEAPRRRSLNRTSAERGW